tara:strand:+ start:21128 stop:21961 length:834 start_codon:yes stop_codon:yes gene_type:complete
VNIFKIINHKIKKICFYNSYSILQFYRIIFGINQTIGINNWSLILPPKHLFSLYKKEHKYYDKYLVNLSKRLNKSDSIIDIGANVGDTLYQIINKKSNFKYFCVEGDKFFASYLKKNIANLPIFNQKKIKVIEEIVGKNLIGNLIGTGGTKSFKYDKSGRKSKTLNEIVNYNKIKNIKIIKVDVDGHDYNIINSGLKIIKKFNPIIYFEIMIIDKFSVKNYKNTIYKLNQIGYKKWTILDNYGNKIFENENTSFFLKYIEKFKFGDLYDIACSNKKL